MEQKDILKISHVYKLFPGVQALKDINLTIKEGTVHVLCGENGAGKSTLMKIINGIHQPNMGAIQIYNKTVKIKNPIQAKKLGISMIFQELNYVPEMTIEESLVLGDWPLTPLNTIDWKKIRKDITKLLKEEGLNYSPTTKLKELTVSDVQMLEIIKSIANNAKIFIMDEPTSAITNKEVDRLFNKIDELKKKGAAIIYISHKMDEIFEICDDVAVLRDGKMIFKKSTKETSMNELISAMVGRSLDKRYPDVDNTPGEDYLFVEHLNTKFDPVLQDISFTVKKGEIFGLYGLVGAGRSELLESLFGIRTIASGNIIVGDKKLHFHSSKDAMNYSFALVTEERKLNGMFGKDTIKFNTVITNLGSYKRAHLLSNQKMTDAATRQIKVMNTKCVSPEQLISALSGGNQQKVIIGKWMERSPEIFLMDEPTRGIDVGAKYEIYQLIIQMAKEGKTIIVVSSEMPEILGITNRIAVMSNHRLAGIVNTKETDQEELLRLSAKYL